MSDSLETKDRPVNLRARWVMPVDRPPIDGGVVRVADGRIEAVGRHEVGEPVRDLGDVALLPALVNAHTHLEFSSFDEPWGTPGQPFHIWLSQIIARRRELFTEPIDRVALNRTAVGRGLAESHQAGVAALGEIAVSDWSETSFDTANRPESVIVFYELLGLAADRVDPLIAEARAHLQRAKTHAAAAGRELRFGLSPHAPYTVHPRLLREACGLSAEAKAPLAMHLAESWEELELLQSHSGGLVETLESFERWYPGELPRGLRPYDYLEMLATAHRALVVHGNYLIQDELEFIASQPHLSVVYCPRTQSHFNHGRYPLAEMLRAGVRVAIGTDSRSSSPDLSLWSELRHIRQHHPHVSPQEALKLGTLNGAEALGVDGDWGSITPGKRAVLLQVPLPPSSDGSREAAFDFEQLPQRVDLRSSGFIPEVNREWTP